MDKKTVIALGYFDGVHIGHRQVILKAKELSKKLGCSLTVLTFKGDLRKAITGKSKGVIYTFNERKNLIYSLGADNVYGLSVSKSFLKLGKLAFLNYLNKKFNVLGYVSGQDYTFGKNGGNVNFLKEYALKNGQTAISVDPIVVQGEKASSTNVKKLLENGDIKSANVLLGSDYFISGKIVKDRSVGAKLGFPTANLSYSGLKFAIKKGVYSGYAILNGKKYLAVINNGSRPTYMEENVATEAHFINFNGNLYGKEVKLYFKDYLRDIQKFSNENLLKEKIAEDVFTVQNSND